MIPLVAAPARPAGARAIRRYFRTPKGLLAAILIAIASLGMAPQGAARVLPGVVAPIAAAMLLDACILRWRRQAWIFPSGALLTGLIVAMVLSPSESPAIGALTAVSAVASKYLLRFRTANVFNPSALALVAAAVALGSAQSWWGALSELPAPALVLMLAGGWFIAQRVNKLPSVLAFLGAYFALFSISALGGNSGQVAEIFRPPDLQAALFLAFFMLDDPPTCPIKHVDQVWYGSIVAAAAATLYLSFGVAYFLLAGLLAGNLWEFWRRWRAHREGWRPAR